ncbi:MAG: hypothetical protein ACT4PT_02905 [Methanobacteriota archaeon]
MRPKQCPLCGRNLCDFECGNGVVWQCAVHGVRDWSFSEGSWKSRPRQPA